MIQEYVNLKYFMSILQQLNLNFLQSTPHLKRQTFNHEKENEDEGGRSGGKHNINFAEKRRRKTKEWNQRIEILHPSSLTPLILSRKPLHSEHQLPFPLPPPRPSRCIRLTSIMASCSKLLLFSSTQSFRFREMIPSPQRLSQC